MKSKRSAPSHLGEVFINCPFDAEYEPLFRALAFAILACGFKPRCALEIDDGSEVRLEKIYRLMQSCQFSLHDISRTELDAVSKLPRFNMPFELGLFLGLGRALKKPRPTLILDAEPYRYQKFISDIAGQDIRAHMGDPLKAMSQVRNWLNTHVPNAALMGGAALSKLYNEFTLELPSRLKHARLEPSEITFVDWMRLTSAWLGLTNRVGPIA
ncbi:MAG: hypothetical protein ACKVY0_20700 [Prosthecobacter sp.]|uniref:hypothetical protein n=1 Tax=Prosthecobacter sp. TaxID=1965333 RepID=UPI0038FF801F